MEQRQDIMKIITEKSTALELKEQLTEMKAAPVTGNRFSVSKET
jgi:hypothetical protein